MKALKTIAWISGIIAGILMLLGVLFFIFKFRIFGINQVVNMFHVANSFLLVSICCLLYKSGETT